MVDDGIDPILCGIRRCQLFNNRHDRVKVMLIAAALSTTIIRRAHTSLRAGVPLGEQQRLFIKRPMLIKKLRPVVDFRQSGVSTLNFLPCLYSYTLLLCDRKGICISCKKPVLFFAKHCFSGTSREKTVRCIRPEKW